MRVTFIVLLFVGLLTFAIATPAKEKKKTLSCVHDCGEVYEPVCSRAKNNGSKERLLTFGSQCVMNNYNCEHAQDQFEIKNKGECGGNVSVRLS